MVVVVLDGSDRVGTATISASATALAGVSAGDLGRLIGPGAFAIGSFGCDDGVGASGRAGIVRELLLPLASLVVDDVAMASPELDVVVVMMLVSAVLQVLLLRWLALLLLLVVWVLTWWLLVLLLQAHQVSPAWP